MSTAIRLPDEPSLGAPGTPGHACTEHCPEGFKCCLNGAIEHHWHICKNEWCDCHGQPRYDEERKMAQEGPEVPRGVPPE